MYYIIKKTNNNHFLLTLKKIKLIKTNKYNLALEQNKIFPPLMLVKYWHRRSNRSSIIERRAKYFGLDRKPLAWFQTVAQLLRPFHTPSKCLSKQNDCANCIIMYGGLYSQALLSLRTSVVHRRARKTNDIFNTSIPIFVNIVSNRIPRSHVSQ